MKIENSKNRPLLEVRDLSVHFFTDEGVVRAVEQVSFEIYQGKILGVVGESGCGKSVTSLSILRLIPEPPGKIVGGQIFFEGQDLLQLDQKQMVHVRGNEISMIFQEPMTSLNPVFRSATRSWKRFSFTRDLIRARLEEKRLKCSTGSKSRRRRPGLTLILIN